MENAPFFIDNEVIVLSRQGVWLADGIEITHEGTRRLFARSLVWEEGAWKLRVGRESKTITVEDTPYFVLRAEGSAEDGYVLLLNDETRERLDPSTLSYRPGRLTARVKGGRWEAKFLSAPYMDVLQNLHENGREYYLVLGQQHVTLLSK